MKKKLSILSVMTLLGASLAQAPVVLAEEIGQDESVEVTDTDNEVSVKVEVDGEGEVENSSLKDEVADDSAEETSDDEWFFFDPDEYSPAVVEMWEKIEYIEDGFRGSGGSPGLIYGDLVVIIELSERRTSILKSDLSDDEKVAQLQEVYDDMIIELKNAHGDNFNTVMYFLSDEGRVFIRELYALIDQVKDSQLQERYLDRLRDYHEEYDLPELQALEQEVKALLNSDNTPSEPKPEPDQEPSEDPNDSDQSGSKVVVNTEVHGLPNDVRQVFDDQLAEGELVVDIIGVPGLVEVITYADGSTAERILEEPIERVERTGTNKDLVPSESQKETQADSQEVKEASSKVSSNQAATSKGEKLPETGEASNLITFAMGALTLLAGLGFTFKKKEN